MKGQAISFIYSLSIIMQALFTLLFSAAAFVGVGYLLTLAGVGTWVYIPAILLGLGLGMWSMVKFILVAMAGLGRLERANEKRNRRGR